MRNKKFNEWIIPILVSILLIKWIWLSIISLKVEKESEKALYELEKSINKLDTLVFENITKIRKIKKCEAI